MGSALRVPSTVALSQPVVEREPATTGQVKQYCPAHDCEILTEVSVLVHLLRSRVFPITMRQSGGDDEIYKGKQRHIAGCDTENKSDTDQDLSTHRGPDPEGRIGHVKGREIIHGTLHIHQLCPAIR